METRSLTVENVELIVPAFLLEYWPHHILLNDFPSFCGVGSGFGDAVIPDTNYGLSMSPLCFIHDISWAIAEPSWADFHQSNSMFMHNQLALITNRSRFPLRQLRSYRAVSYFNAVDTVGAAIFWAEKKDFAGYDNPIEHPGIHEKLQRVKTLPILKAA